MRPYLTTVLTIAAACTLAGCSGGERRPVLPTASVSGKVTFNGQPVKAGIVFMENKKDGVSQGLPIENGAFSGTAPVGSYVVSILPPPITHTSADPVEMEKKPQAADIPEKYHATATSGFTAEIKQDSPNDTLNFAMSG